MNRATIQSIPTAPSFCQYTRTLFEHIHLYSPNFPWFTDECVNAAYVTKYQKGKQVTCYIFGSVLANVYLLWLLLLFYCGFIHNIYIQCIRNWIRSSDSCYRCTYIIHNIEPKRFCLHSVSIILSKRMCFSLTALLIEKISSKIVIGIGVYFIFGYKVNICLYCAHSLKSKFLESGAHPCFWSISKLCWW